MLLTFVGSPVLYYGDEIGMGDNIWLDDRNGVRTPMQWNDQTQRGLFATADRLYAPVIDDDALAISASTSRRSKPIRLRCSTGSSTRCASANNIRRLDAAICACCPPTTAPCSPTGAAIKMIACWSSTIYRIKHQPIELPDDLTYIDLLSDSLITRHSSLSALSIPVAATRRGLSMPDSTWLTQHAQLTLERLLPKLELQFAAQTPIGCMADLCAAATRTFSAPV